jgi:nucleoside-diphosphate-sugar epimerase
MMSREPDAPRLIVLGGTGFIGRALIAAAPGSVSIGGVQGRSPRGLRECLRAVAADAIVVHAAGSVARTAAPTDSRAYVASTNDLFDAIAASGSTAKVLTLGSVAERLPGAGAYASVKREQRAVAEAASERHGIPWRHLLVHNLVGPAAPATLAPGAMVRRLREVIAADGRTLPVINGAAVRDYLDVRDVAAIVVALGERFDTLDRDRPLEICSGIGRSVHAIAAALVAASGAAIEVVESGDSDDLSHVVGDPAPLRTLLGAAAGVTIDFGASIADLWESSARFHLRASS